MAKLDVTTGEPKTIALLQGLEVARAIQPLTILGNPTILDMQGLLTEVATGDDISSGLDGPNEIEVHRRLARSAIPAPGVRFMAGGSLPSLGETTLTEL